MSSTASTLLCRVYELYNNYVLKNPFYEVEMPVRCELFDTNLISTVAMLHRRWGVVTQ
jgi:trafficking protein particle complex subunit 4